MKKYKWIIGISGLFFYTTSFAIMPVIDPTEIAKTMELIQEAENQLSQLKDLSKINSKQYDYLVNNLSGNFGYGNLLNGTSDLNKRQWSNDNWVDVLNEASGGNASAFAAAQKKYDQLYPVKAANEIVSTRGKDNLARTHYQQSSQISRAALAASSYSYDQLNEHIKNLHDMLAKLDSQPSEKAALDINARLVAELGFIQLELLRQQTFQNQLSATQTQGEVNGMSDQSQFMKWNP